MDYAVIRTGGKQYRVSTGDVIEVEKLVGEPGDTVTFEDVLLQKADDKVVIGMPFIKELSVTGKVVDQFKHDKIRVMKYKAKVRYRRTTGHRQQLTRIKIETIEARRGEAAKKASPVRTEKAPAGKLSVRKTITKTTK